MADPDTIDAEYREVTVDLNPPKRADFARPNISTWAKDVDFRRNGYRLPDWCERCDEQHSCCRCRDGGWLRAARDPEDGRPVRTQWGSRDLSVLVACDCRLSATSRAPFDARKFGVPQKLAEATVASWGPGNCREVIGARNYLVQWPPARPWLVLMGLPGRGKTGLAVGILREAYERYGVNGRMTTVERALARFKATFDNDNRTETEDQVMQDYLHRPLLVLDDLGAEKATDWAAQQVFAMLNGRYGAELPTVITGNDDSWGALDARVKSRLLDGVPLRFTGPDRRAA